MFPALSAYTHPTHQGTVETPNPVLLLIAPMFDELALLPLLHDCCCENEPLACGPWGLDHVVGSAHFPSHSAFVEHLVALTSQEVSSPNAERRLRAPAPKAQTV